MALVEMQKIRLLTHSHNAEGVLKVIQEHGVVEFGEVSNDQLTLSEPEDFALRHESAQLDFAVDFLSRYAPERGGLQAALEGDQERVSRAQLAETVAHAEDVHPIIAEIEDLQKELNDLQGAVTDCDKREKAVLPWLGAHFVVGKQYHTAATQTFLVEKKTGGTKDKKIGAHDVITDALSEIDAPTHFTSVDDRRAVLTCLNDDVQDVLSVSTAQGYETVELAEENGAPEDVCRAITQEREALVKKITACEDRARAFAEKHLATFKVLSDDMMWHSQRHDLLGSAARTKDVIVYEGWCVAGAYDALDQALAHETPYYALEKIQAAEDEKPPVEIENGTAAKPFEAVTRLYGLPGHRDLDPTPYLAGFFFVFFGFCLTDVGYGAILAAVTGYLLWRYDVAQGTKIMLELLFLGGVASFVAGLFFGGYLGLDMAHMPAFLQNIQLFDPIANPMPIFYLALALGVVQVITGLVLAIVRGKRYGEFQDALLDNGPWILLFVALIIWGATKMAVFTLPGAVYLVYAALAAIVVTQGRKEKSIILKGVKGVMSLYDSVGYFADILSYSRLLALGLATSALAFAVNLIAGMAAGDDGSIVGMFFAAIILIIGHLFNLAINAFGAFIHSARLQFVEFFAKFVTGTGRLFAPFKREERHVTFTD